MHKMLSLLTGVVMVATLLTGLVYLWALNASTVYERTSPAPKAENPPS
jgi:hypothetical protein